MKKLIYISTSLLLLLSSCNDFLETSSDSKKNDENVFKTLYYTESAVLGVYDRLADEQMYARCISMNWSTNNDIEFAGADEKSYNQNNNRGVSNYYATAGSSLMQWNKIYQMIERANLVIQGINQSPLLSGTEKEQAAMKSLRAEAIAMRAMGYYQLVIHWGDVPFKTEPTKSDLSNVYLPKTDRDTITTHLINDLLSVEKDIAWVGESAGSVSYSTSERITKGFVKGMIARIALARGGYSLRDKPGYPTERPSDYLDYYKIAHQQTQELISSGRYKLKTNYSDIWQNVCALETDGANGENLYEVAFGLSQSGEVGYSIGVRFYTNTKYGYGNNSNVVNTSAYYYYSFEKEDTRKDATIATATYSNSNKDQKEFFISNPMSYNFAKWDQRWMSKNAQWLSINLGANGKWGYGINWIDMRYSDILLMFAETENELNGPTTLAKNALKEVRDRAFAGTTNKNKNTEEYVNKLTTKELFFNAIVNERAWEFGGEAIRKFDLIRWNLLEVKIQEQRDALNAMIDGGSAKIFDKTYESTDIPEFLYYKYNSDKENIEKSAINYYETNDELDALTTKELQDLGYTKVKWMTGFSDDNKISYKERIKLYSSGLLKDYNNVCDNRYLYPIHSSVIGDYQGILTNSYGY